MSTYKSYFEITPDDFPPGEPGYKQKRGYFYRPNNAGYTSEISEAGLYSREEIIQCCFDNNGKNGLWDVLGIPIRQALRDYTAEQIKEKIARLEDLLKYVSK